ncbi:MAG TPA: BatA domain-containing protein [Vicinamibacterales bacterium]|nr:BatA domain-containing protein [Vicinamibacterales bacterium]
MLSFLSPLFLFGAAAAAIPIVLHLLKREPEPRIEFPAVRLLKRAPVENTERHRLRELLLLALRVATLVLLALAFARPFMPSGAAASASGVTIVVLDTSYSLAAPGRFERAKQLAADAVQHAPAGDRVGVVTFSDEAQIAAKATEDRVLASSAINEATAGFGSTRYRAALSAASQALDGRKGHIVVVTDLQEGGWDVGDRASVPDGTRVDIVDVGALPENLAVTNVQPMPDRVVATVRNGGSKQRDVRAHLAIDGRPAGDATASIAAGQSADVVFAGSPKGTCAAVTVDDPDGIQPDNVRYAIVGRGGKATVGVVSATGDLATEAFYVQHALSTTYQPVALSGAKLASATDEQVASHVAILLLSTRNLERHGRELLTKYVQSGGGLLIAAGADVDGDVIADLLGQGTTLRVVTAPAGSNAQKPVGDRSLAPADFRHPIFRPFASNGAALGLVKFRTVSKIGGDGCQPIARFTSGDVAAIDCSAGDGRAIVVASDLDNRWNDFPLHATFVPFLHEAVQYVGAGRTHASEVLIADAPARLPRKPGIVTLAHNRTVALNVDPRESDPARLTTEEFQAAVTPMKMSAADKAQVAARQQEDSQHLWQYAIALMVLTLLVEGFIAARTA